MSDTPEPNPNDWLKRLVEQGKLKPGEPTITERLMRDAGPRQGEVAPNDLVNRFKQNVGDALGIDCSFPLIPIERRNQTWQAEAALKHEDIHPDGSGALCTIRLQQLLGEWLFQKIPDLLDARYVICGNLNVTDYLEGRIASTLEDYKTLGILAKGINVDLFSTKAVLRKCWAATVESITNKLEKNSDDRGAPNLG